MIITHLELETNHLSALQWFYTHQLGLALLQQTSDQVTFQLGWSKLTFRQTNQPVAPYHFAINVPLYSLEQYELWYDVPYIDTSAPGHRIAHFPDWKARASYFRDPAGNLVEFIERKDAGYTNGYFQGISEIGLVADDVIALATQLLGDYPVSLFSKSQPKADFTVLGDDYGLFILAQTNRPWLFTDIPASAGYCRVSFTDQYGLWQSSYTSHVVPATHPELVG
ncbi:VOC family protein [Spirosoma telluris]|uniref:VOC family protein n=1 Tax=Spirosoma telluris TaxID=2183553 RepID=UPI0018DE0654